MQFTHSSGQDVLEEEFDGSSPFSLLKYGLNCVERGHCAEGVVLLSMAREQLLPNQIQLVDALAALMKAITSCSHARQKLHEASKRFAESDSEQLAQIEALKKLLPTLGEDIPPLPSTENYLRETPGMKQSLRLLRPLTSISDYNEEDQTPSSEDRNTLPALYITCFGRFEVRRLGPLVIPISLCSNLKGQAILRYLVTRPKHRETVDMLMEALWPEEELETVQHKLRVAISALRCSLNKGIVSEPGGGYILCKDQGYQLNPSVTIRSDVDEFLELYKAGREAGGSTEATLYEKACRMYTGPFLTEDLYTEWSFIRREELNKTYVIMCDRLAEFNLEIGCYDAAAKWASAILQVDRCDEEAHRQLIRTYAAQGRRSEAMRQYRHCQRVLSKELGVEPAPETQKLLQMLVSGTDSSNIEKEIPSSFPLSRLS